MGKILRDVIRAALQQCFGIEAGGNAQRESAGGFGGADAGGGVFDQSWDAHNGIKPNHEKHAREVDLPIAGLLTDLKQRGLFDDTLVVFHTEFGRMPFTEGSSGRDHNPKAFSVWLAGAGVKGGTIFGASDEIGYKAAEIEETNALLAASADARASAANAIRALANITSRRRTSERTAKIVVLSLVGVVLVPVGAVRGMVPDVVLTEVDAPAVDHGVAAALDAEVHLRRVVAHRERALARLEHAQRHLDAGSQAEARLRRPRIASHAVALPGAGAPRWAQASMALGLPRVAQPVFNLILR